ncbi:MAG TPA: substrate-binding domain-containing protein [Nitrospira sp.]|nr:substrate-binding domain-containing protein [Nitrospira sp.]
MDTHSQQPEPASTFSNRLKRIRTERGLSQSELATQAGVTRQAISAIESNLYLPTTVVALKLASVLDCHVEDLFSLAPPEDIVEGTLIGNPSPTETTTHAIRVKVSTIGKRTIIRPITDLGDQLAFAVPADGYLTHTDRPVSGNTVRVTLSRDRDAIEQAIAVAGCDPAIFLAGEHLRRHKDRTTVVGWQMGSMAALQALQRGEVHVAGLHLFDPVTGESNLPFLKRALKGSGYDVVTFATWEEGFLVRRGNPKSIRSAEDLAESLVTLVNREEGSGARLLLDQRLRSAGMSPTQVQGYDRIVSTHFDVARTIAERHADVGIGIRSAAQHFDLDFVPLQAARYDLIVPKVYLKSHPTLTRLFDTLVTGPFRNEIAALGGYDTSETGKLQPVRAA